MTTRRIGPWAYTGDISPEDHGGKWYRRVATGTYQVIEITNMNEACGSDNDGRDPYVVELSLVDLTTIPSDAQALAVRYAGVEDEDLTQEMLAIVCYESGCRATLESWSGRAYCKLLRAARSAAHALARDASALAERMDRPVNAIGSTATEYMQGDVTSAILRGVSDGNPAADLMLRMGMGIK